MVFFCCNKCGEGVKKAQVDKHMFQCRTGSFSCMDCQKNFAGDEYKGHTKCISEEEKYAGDGWKAPTNRNKGEKKQMAWFETVQATMETAGKTLMPAARNLLQALTKHENVPRKKPKFLNFIRNVGRNQFDERTIDQVWGLLEAQWKSETEKIKQEAEKQKLIKLSAAAPGDPPAKDKKEKKKKKKDKSPADEETEKSAPEASDSITENYEETTAIGEEDKVKRKKNKKKRKTQDLDVEVSENPGKTSTENIITENGTPVDQINDLEVTPSKKSKKQKRKRDESLTSENIEFANPLVGETPRKKEKKSKAEGSDPREALNGHDDNSLIDVDSQPTDEFSNNLGQNGLTPEELKAKLKAEKKAARKAAKAFALTA